VDVFVRPIDASGDGGVMRITRGGGQERWPQWAPDNARVSFAASRPGQGAGVWVAEASAPDASAATGGAGAGRGGARAGGRGGGRGGGAGAQPLTQLASRHAGAAAWSPDGQTMLIATEPSPGGTYNGNPNRNDDD